MPYKYFKNAVVYKESWTEGALKAAISIVKNEELFVCKATRQ